MKQKPPQEPAPKLAPPGAGLPFIEGLVARYILYPQGMRRFDWMGSLELLREETKKILTLAQGMPLEDFTLPVLIPRLRGLEDSSRYWSVAMTIEHLIITMNGMTSIARDLATGRKLDITVSMANVKPSPLNTLTRAQMLENFSRAAEATEKILQPLADTAGKVEKLRHPFFGDMPAQGWVWVLGIHQALHRKQIEEILRRT